MSQNNATNSNQLITVIVLCYGDSKRILPTIDSILIQKHVNIEIIVSNDGGSGFDSGFIENYISLNNRGTVKIFKVLSFAENVGTVKNINRAIMASSGEYVKVIGDDLFSDDTIFYDQLSFLKNNIEYDLVIGFSAQCDENFNCLNDTRIEKTNSLLESFYRDTTNNSYIYCRKKGLSPFVTQAACFRKSFFEKYGFFDERFFLLEDAPLGAKLLIDHIPVGVLKKVSVYHVCGTGVSTGKKKIDPRKIKYYRDLLLYTNIFIKPFKRILGRFFVIMTCGTAEYRVRYAQAILDKKKILFKTYLFLRYSFPLLLRSYYGIYRSFR